MRYNVNPKRLSPVLSYTLSLVKIQYNNIPKIGRPFETKQENKNPTNPFLIQIVIPLLPTSSAPSPQQ